MNLKLAAGDETASMQLLAGPGQSLEGNGSPGGPGGSLLNLAVEKIARIATITIIATGSAALPHGGFEGGIDDRPGGPETEPR